MPLIGSYIASLSGHITSLPATKMAERSRRNGKACQHKKLNLTSHPKQVFACETDDLEAYECPECNFSSHSLIDFRKDHTTANFAMYSCQKCGNFKTLSSLILEKHQTTCTSKISQEHECQYCNDKTESFDAKILHILNYHTAPDDFTMFECPHCGGQTKLATSNDIFADINDSSNCKFCTKPQNVVECERLGTNAGCDFTEGEWFLKKLNCRSRVAMKICPWFKCDQCKFRAKTEKGIRGHLRKRHYKTSYVRCAFCDYRAIDSWRLKEHVRKVHVESDSLTNWDHDYALRVTLQ